MYAHRMDVDYDPGKAAANLKAHGSSARRMRPEYDFSKGKRGALIPRTGKTRISIFIDNTVLAQFRAGFIFVCTEGRI